MKQLVLLIVFFVSAQSIMAHNVTFMTYNILNYDGLNFQIFRIPKLAQIISASGADVVAVQEISGNSNFNSLKDKTGLSGSWFDIAGNGYGIGVLWKSSLGTPKITNVKVDPVSSSTDSESRAFIMAEFSDFCFIAAHFSLNSIDRDSMVVKMIQYVKSVGKTVFVGGDFNAEPTYRALVTLQNNNFKILNTLSDYTYSADNPTSLIDMILGYRNNSTDKEYTVISRGIPTAPSGVTYSDVSDHLPYCVTVDLESARKQLVVNSNGTNATTEGTFTWCLNQALDGDVIHFNIDGTELCLTDVVTMKSITIDGLNAFNGKSIVLKQSTTSKGFFSLASGISATFKNLDFDGTTVLGNTAITTANGSTLTIDACTFKNINAQANNGGAARIQGIANIINTSFENNITGGSYGGGALCIYNAADITIDKCSFIGNSSIGAPNRGGGAIVARGTVVNPCNVKISNSTFANNVSANTGSALMASVQSSSDYMVNLTAVNCTFTGNQGNGAISALTTVKGKANVYLVNSIVVNNVDAASSAYSDLLETLGGSADPAATAIIEPHNVIYSVASASIVTTDRNCIQVGTPSTPDIFKELETYATDKKRPVLSTLNDQTIAMISSSSIAKGTGAATLSGYTIPTFDQLGETRPTDPAIGAVEFKDLSSNIMGVNDKQINIVVKGRKITISGLIRESEMTIYGLTGNLLYKSVVKNNETISLDNILLNLVIIRLNNQSFKVFLK